MRQYKPKKNNDTSAVPVELGNARSRFIVKSMSCNNASQCLFLMPNCYLGPRLFLKKVGSNRLATKRDYSHLK